MDWQTYLRERFEAAGRPVTDAVIEELAEHAADLERDATGSGLGGAEIRRRVDAHLGEWLREVPDRRSVRPSYSVQQGPSRSNVLTSLGRDVLHALRMLVRQPGPSAVGAVTIGLAIGAVAVMATLVWRVIYQPLPWPEPDRLVRIYESRRGGTPAFGQFGEIMTNGSFLAWQEQPATITGIAAWAPNERTLDGIGPAERVRTASITPSLFDVLRVRPLRGRPFLDADTPPGTPRVAIVSEAFWRQRLDAAPEAIGRVVRLDGEAFTIVGVMDRRFTFPDAMTAIWLPLRVPPTVTPGSQNGSIKIFSALARLAPGTTIPQAAAEAAARANAAPKAGPVSLAIFGSDGPAEMKIVSALDDQIREVKPALLVLLAAVGLLLAASAGNVANVQLARALARRRELAIRSALGADAGRLARQLLVESAVVGVAGGLAGLALAALTVTALPAWLPEDFPRIDEIAMDWRGVLVALGAAVLAGAAAGVLPAWHARREVTTAALSEDGQTAIGLGRRSTAARARAVVMAAQVAIATVLLVGSALLGLSFIKLLDADRGFDTTQVLTAELPVPGDESGARRRAVLDEVVSRVSAVPGVAAVGYTSILPLSGSESIRAFEMRGRDGQKVVARTSFRIVSAGYMKAIGMRARAGRVIGEADTSSSGRVCVVNAAFARTYLDDTPLDEHLPGDSERGDYTVIGVVEDVRTADTTPVGPEMFVPQSQWTNRNIGGDPVVAVRSVASPVELAPILRSLVASVDSSLALGKVATMEERVVELLARPRLYSGLLTAFASLALAIAAVGLFGVLSFSVAQRSRELAVRSALGASPGSLLQLVMRQALGLTAAGVAIGLAASAALAGALQRWLYGLTGTEPGIYVAVSALMLAIAALACAAPARRAARQDPLVVLKGN
jgi:predicted permease